MNRSIHIKESFARMRQAMAECEISATEMARKYDIERKRFSQMRSTPSISTLYYVAIETGYSVDWMLGLTEEKIRKEKES